MDAKAIPTQARKTSAKKRGIVMKTEMTRKEFLHVVTWGLAAGAGATLLAGCGGKEEQAQTATQKPTTKPAVADPCADVSALSQPELTMRNETLKYVAHSTEPDKRCDNCKFWEPPSNGDETCGACTLIKGPINPKGYCTSWFTRET
jgi:hypothetical protein